ncbi:MAG: hypothetical protein AB1584_04635 [Pseudomonadota bacterium]
MNALLRDYWLVWRMALSTRHRRANVFILALAVLVALVIGLLVQLKHDDPVLSLGLSLRIALGVLLASWLIYFVPGAVKLNSPVNARLVPRLRRRLIQLTALVWVLMVATVTLMTLETRLTPALVFLGAGTWIAAFGLGQSGHRLGQWVQLSAWLFIVFHKHLPPGLLESLQSGTGFAAATLLMLAFAAFALQGMFMDGGERHYAAREAQVLQTERLTASGQFRERSQVKFGASFYRWALRRDCQAGEPGKLLAHLLGSMNHWSYRAVMLGAFMAISALALAAVRAFAGPELQQMVTDVGWAAFACMMLLPLFENERRNVRVKDTAAEQALFRLAPRLPVSAPAFNRKVAATLLRIALLEWGMLAATVLCLGVMTGASAANLFMQACLCCMTLPLVGGNLRDHARRVGPLGWQMLIGLIVSIGVSFAFGMVAQKATGLPVMAGAALTSIVIALVVVALGFRRAEGAPCAFPAGRLA